MCVCQNVGEFFLYPDSFSNIFSNNYEMKNRFSHYTIEEAPCEETHPKFDYDMFYYVCSECEQAWYFECYPDTPTAPVLGLNFQL